MRLNAFICDILASCCSKATNHRRTTRRDGIQKVRKLGERQAAAGPDSVDAGPRAFWYDASVNTDDILALVGRLFIAIIFLASAFGKITNFDGTLQYMEAHGMPSASIFCVAAITVETLGATA